MLFFTYYSILMLITFAHKYFTLFDLYCSITEREIQSSREACCWWLKGFCNKENTHSAAADVGWTNEISWIKGGPIWLFMWYFHHSEMSTTGNMMSYCRLCLLFQRYWYLCLQHIFVVILITYVIATCIPWSFLSMSTSWFSALVASFFILSESAASVNARSYNDSECMHMQELSLTWSA